MPWTCWRGIDFTVSHIPESSDCFLMVLSTCFSVPYISPNLGISFKWLIRWRPRFLAGIFRSWCCVYFLLRHSRRHIMSDCPTLTDDKCDYQVSVGRLCFPFWLQWSVGVTLGLLRDTKFPVNFSSNGFSLHWGCSPETLISLEVAKWWFPNCIIPSTFISGHSSMEKRFCSSKGVEHNSYWKCRDHTSFFSL